MTSITQVSKIFQTFAERECKAISPLYYQLSQQIAQEETLLTLAANCQKRQPIPNLFLAAIHYLLLQLPSNSNEKLVQYYPSITKTASDGIPIDLFKEFCERRKQEIIEILQSRIVQTNAVNRTAHLMPIFSAMFEGEKAINLIDIGASSGLNLNLDLYEYNYGQNRCFGKSKVKIKSDLLEGKLPHFSKIVKVKRKIGTDQNPLDLKQKDNALWLKALIWADRLQRFERLEAAIEVAQNSHIDLRKASTLEGFRSIIEEIPLNEPLTIYHTHVLCQFTKQERTAFRKMLDDIGNHRNLYYLAVEGGSVFDKESLEKEVLIEKTTYLEGKKNIQCLATTNGHATWIKWKS